MIEIKLKRQTLMLTEKEIVSLLALNPELWESAIKRGKGVLRYRKDRDRQAVFKGKANLFEQK